MYVKILLALTSSVVSFFVVELSYRFLDDQDVWTFRNFVFEEFFGATMPSVFRREVGWEPKPDTVIHSKWKTRVSILQNGLRSNGKNPLLSDAKPVLAVGGSFTFGDQVSDEDSWPAMLERSLGVPILNGGVCGYGFGQTIRRARELVREFDPKVVIVQFIPASIVRAELYEFYGLKKPYYSLNNDRLTYHTAHVTPPVLYTDQISERIWRILGYSWILSDALYERVSPQYTGDPYKSKHEKGAEVSCRLLEKFVEELGDDTELLLLAQYKGGNIRTRMQVENPVSKNAPDPRRLYYHSRMMDVIDCARDLGIELADSYQIFSEIVNKEGAKSLERFYGGHMTSNGNRVIAEFLAPQVHALL